MTAAGRHGDAAGRLTRSAEGDPAGIRLVRAIVWGAGTLAVAAIALAATINLLDLVVRLITEFSAPYGRLGIAFTAAYVLGGAVSLVTAWRVGNRPVTRRWLLPLAITALAVGVRAVVAITFDAPLTGENRIVHEQAVQVLDGGPCCFSHRPMGYPLTLAGAYALLGVRPGAIEILNIAFAALTTWLVFGIGRVAWDRRVGALAATTFAVMPSQVLMTLPPLTEPLYTAVVAAIVRLAVGPPSRALVATAAVGLAIAAAQYVRATAASLLAPVALLPMLAGAGLRRSVEQAVAVVAIFVVAMLPVISFNLQTHGDLSVSTSAYAGWSLFVGANQAEVGRWNRDDAALFTNFPGGSVWARSEHAGGLGVRRILDDPRGFLEMQPRKFAVLWGDETYAAGYSLVSDRVVTREARVGWLLGQLFYVPILVLGLAGLILERRNPRPTVLLIGMIVFVVAATHLFLEVHSRYHAYLVPLFGVLAAGGVDAIARHRFRLRDARTA